MNNQIGVTERADPTVNKNWLPWVRMGKPTILITKMPRLLLPMLTGTENIIVHCTITGMGHTDLEPNIDRPNLSLEFYHRICTLIGKDRVVLRIDPIIIPKDQGVLALKRLSREAEGRTRISFLDLYPHVKVRLRNPIVGIQQNTFHAPFEERKAIWKYLGKPEVCSEPGLPNTPCVSEKDCKILGVEPSQRKRGQRPLCGCLANKVELLRKGPRCSYGCLYCYWK